jgi:hypothetical protein
MSFDVNDTSSRRKNGVEGQILGSRSIGFFL